VHKLSCFNIDARETGKIFRHSNIFAENHSAEVIFDQYIDIHHHMDKQRPRKDHRGHILCMSSHASLALIKHSCSFTSSKN